MSSPNHKRSQSPKLPKRLQQIETVKRVCKMLIKKKNPEIREIDIDHAVDGYIKKYGPDSVNDILEECNREVPLEQLPKMFNL